MTAVTLRPLLLLLVSVAILGSGAAGASHGAASGPPIVYVDHDRIVVGGKKLTRGHFPRWSPDGKRIAFTRLDDLYVMNADGSHVRKIVSGPGHELYPAWSPDGRTIAFASTPAGGEHEVYTVRANGKSLRRVTRTAPHVDDVHPAFSPDGRFIVFASNRVAYWNYELYRVRVDGTDLTRLTFWGSGRDGDPGDDVMPEYSPNGKRIAFVSQRGGGYAVWTMKANGKGLRRVAQHGKRTVVFPRWSRDGRSLLYSTIEPQAVRTVRADGTGARVVGRGTEADW